MRWFPIDGARLYLSDGMTNKKGEPIVSRKALYGMVRAGLKVVRLGEGERRDKRGRHVACRLMFCGEWIDQFLSDNAAQTSSSSTADAPIQIRRRA